MDTELNYSLVVREEKEYVSLYDVYIAEVNEKGEDVEGIEKWIPFHYSLFFEAKSIKYVPAFGFERDASDIESEAESVKKPKNKKPDSKRFDVKFVDSEHISGSLQLDPDGRLSRISMFGTERKLNDFSLWITIGKSERCRFWGYPQYSYEDADFRDSTEPDQIGFEITIKEEKFRALANLIVTKSLSSLHLHISGAEGLYSPWSPSIIPQAIKILTDNHELIDQNKALHFRSIGIVHEMNLIPRVSQDLAFSLQIDDDPDDELSVQDDLEISNIATNEYMQMQAKDELNKIRVLLEDIIKKQRLFIYGLGILFLLSLFF